MSHIEQGEARSSGVGWVEGLLALLALIGVFLLVFGSTLSAELNFIDDHELILFATMGNAHPQMPSFSNLSDFIDYDGRFRPLYFGIRIVITQVIGAEPHTWHLIMLAIGVATCWLLYLAARKLGADVLSSALFTLWVIATRGASEIWVRMGPSEPYGMLFTALALWALAHVRSSSRRWLWDAAWLLSLALAGLTKESFVLLFPPMLLLRWLLDTPQISRQAIIASLRRMLPVVLVGGVIFVILLVFVLRTYRPGSYAAGVTSFTLDSFLPLYWYTRFAELSPIAAYYIPIFVFLILAASYAFLGSPKVWVAAVIFLAWVIPQFILHPAGMLNLRFSYPAMIGFAGANALALLRLKRIRVVYVLVLLWSVATLVQPLLGAVNYALRFTAETKSIHRMVQAVKQETQPGEVIVIASNPGARFEATYASIALLGYAGVQEPIYLYVAALPNTSDETNTRLAERLINDHAFANYNDVSGLAASDVSAIIVLTPVDVFLENPPVWFNPDEWSLQQLTEPIMVMSRSGYRQEGEVMQNVFIRNSS